MEQSCTDGRTAPTAPHRRTGFTLVELLVVIGIIALLISILLPSLTRARRAANTVACLANLRSITQSMQIYAAQNKGAILGGAHTTAQFMFVDTYAQPVVANGAYGNANCPQVVQNWDWASPTAAIMGLKFPDGPSQAEREQRWNQLNNFGGFKCPENEFLYTSLGTPAMTVHPTGLNPSYNTASAFHLIRNRGTSDVNGQGSGRTYSRREWNVSSNYGPKVSSVGSASEKIYIADGGRFSSTSGAPSVIFAYISSGGGMYSDVGPWSSFSNAWGRGKAPGNNASGNIDPRVFGFRHGNRGQNGPADTYRFNAAFFDGHAETLGDLQGANPSLWLPRGTTLQVDASQMFPDVFRTYFNSTAQTFTVQ